jgi:N6-adenosine-specific RNA methylase IME4
MSVDVYDIKTRREEALLAHNKRVTNKQAKDCMSLLTKASAVTPESMCKRPTEALKALLDLNRAVERQMAALTETAFDIWRASAISFFKTERRYTLVYADPPWNYNKKSGPNSTDFHYKTMEDDELALMPVRGMTHENSVIAMWATAPKFDVAKNLLTAWGYEFKTVFLTWVKVGAYAQRPIYGTSGSYTKPNCEYLLLGIRGNMQVTQRENYSVESVLETRRAQHSYKPACVRQLLVSVFGDRPRIELFARETEAGWDAWGDEVGKFDSRDDDDDNDDNEEPIRPGRTRVNNLSAKRTKRERPPPIAIGRKDRASDTVNKYYNKPLPGTSMTKNDYAVHDANDGVSSILTAEVVESVRQFNRVVDIRVYFDEDELRKQFNDHRHPLYTSMTNSEARENESLIKRVQDHNEEVLAVINAKPKEKFVHFSDGEIAEVAMLIKSADEAEQKTAAVAMAAAIKQKVKKTAKR